MSPWLLAATGACYAYVAAEYLWQGQYGMCLMFIAYASANAGLILAMRGV